MRLGEWNTTSDVDCDSSYVDEVICTPGHIDVEIDATIVHPNYVGGKTKINDIAMIRLAEDVKFTKFITPICLPSTMKENSVNLTGQNLTVVGKKQCKLIFNQPFLTKKVFRLLRVG